MSTSPGIIIFRWEEKMKFRIYRKIIALLKILLRR